jgi:hypothetical protein
MRKFRLLVFGCVVSVPATLSSAAGVASPGSAGQAAIWTRHDLIVNFRHLPKIYSCDALWYKFRDVLRAIGARPDLTIATFQCGPQLGSLARSPQVHLYFSIPQTVGDDDAHWADVEAALRTVRLEPGHPASIDASDCQLLRQMKDGLLAALPDRVISFKLACEAPSGRSLFNVSVEALTAVQGPARVATRDPPNPGPH